MQHAYKRQLVRLQGFFAVALLPVTYSHLSKLSTWGEFVDRVASTLFFSLAFRVHTGLADLLGILLHTLPTRARIVA